jgi:MFS superfamily sulfate permease-like transporter
MSYASGLAKLNPVAGIYSVAIPGMVYALLGTCRSVVWLIISAKTLHILIILPSCVHHIVLHTLQPHSGGRPISQLSVGPEAALSLLVGQLVTDALTADPHHAPKNPEGVAMAIAGITAMQVNYSYFYLGA